MVLVGIAFKKKIFHFPSVILHLSLKKSRSVLLLPMANVKLQMENEKSFFDRDAQSY
jgi:hypothetical protein